MWIHFGQAECGCWATATGIPQCVRDALPQPMVQESMHTVTALHLLLVDDCKPREWRRLEVRVRVVEQHHIIIRHEHLPRGSRIHLDQAWEAGATTQTRPAGSPQRLKGILTLYPSRTALAMVRYLHGRRLVSVAWNQLTYGGRVML